jgi:hypothetical protein
MIEPRRFPPPWRVDEAQRAFAASASSFSDSVPGTRPLLSLMFSCWCAFPSPGITYQPASQTAHYSVPCYRSLTNY